MPYRSGFYGGSRFVGGEGEEVGVPALGDPFFEDGAPGPDGPVFVPGGGFGFPMGAFPEAPEEEAAVGGVAEGGDEDVAGVVGGELLILVGDDVGGVFEDADAFDFEGLLLVRAEQDDGGGVGGDGFVGEEGDGEFEPVGVDAEADGGAEGGVGSGAQLEFGEDFAMGSAADDAGFDDGEDGFVFGDGVGDGSGELGAVGFEPKNGNG